MTQARKSLIDISSTPYYHVCSRCVRRAFLCGEDNVTGQSFEHRRQWLVDRCKFLAENFAIDICAYAIMSNHYHLVLKVNVDESVAISDDDVVRRWSTMFTSGNIFVERLQQGLASEVESLEAKRVIAKWRKRLTSISWFMGSLNQYISKKANKEDQCRGHFWESRFKSQALLDEMAILGCMMYVDLNPVRAGIAQNLIDSDFTSIQERIETFTEAQQKNKLNDCKSNVINTNGRIAFQPKSLLPFTLSNTNNDNSISFDLLDYLALADWTGRCVHPKKTGIISQHQEELLKVLNINESDWLQLAQHFEQKFAGFAGRASKLYLHANQHGQYHCKGVG